MAKSKSKSHQDSASSETQAVSASGAEGRIDIYDPVLVSLFAQSFGSVKTAARPGPLLDSHPTTARDAEASKSSSGADWEENGLVPEISRERVHNNLSDIGVPNAFILSNDVAAGSSRSRKRKDAEGDLEDRYMSQLASEEVKEPRNRARTLDNKRQKLDTQEVSKTDVGSPDGDGESTSDYDVVTKREEEPDVADVPQHESSVRSKVDLDLEKSSRTVFLANVSTVAIKSKRAKKTLMGHLGSFASLLPAKNGRHGIESFRFRSTAFAARGMPKKAAFAKMEIMDTTTKSTNAYVVYTTQFAAREAVSRLNGSIVLDRHLRVDSVAHPAKIDHRRCVFVGNLAFIDDETNVKAAQDEKINKQVRRQSEPADVEEGLWRQFGKAGTVESVRVVRDKTTRVGKGFAYIQFEDANSVEKALLYHKKSFPPMLPRNLRVTRAKNTKNTTGANRKEGSFLRTSKSKYRPKVPSQVQSLTGRAHKLLGRAGAAKLRATRGQHKASSKSVSDVTKSPEPITFEGFRASSSQEKTTAGRKHEKTSNRSKSFRAKGEEKMKRYSNKVPC